MNVIGALPTDPSERHMGMQLLLLVDYRRQPQIVAQASTVPDSRTEEHILLELERHADAMGATKSQFKRATRCLSGRGTLEGRPCSEGALLFMEPLISRWRKRFSNNVIFGDMPPSSVPPEASCVMAHSVAAYAYFEKYRAASEDFPRILQDAKNYPRPTGQKDLVDRVDNMLHAIRHATFAASMQYITPAVLLVGYAFMDLAKHLHIDVDVIQQCRPLWRALRKRDQDVFTQNCLLQKTPKRDACASALCFTRMTLFDGAAGDVKPCDGTCPAELKPSYCSESCREEDWPRHRGICKPRDPIQPPQGLPLGPDTRERVLRALVLQGPILQVEIVPEDAQDYDLQCGEVSFAADLPSYFEGNKTSRWVWKCYYPER